MVFDPHTPITTFLSLAACPYLSLDQQVVISTSDETATPLVEVGILSKCALPYIRHILAVSPQGCNRVNAASSLGKHLRGFQKR